MFNVGEERCAIRGLGPITGCLCKKLYDALGIAAAEDGRIRFKVKSFRTERMTKTDVATGEKAADKVQ
jgi:hypothetical protein